MTTKTWTVTITVTEDDEDAVTRARADLTTPDGSLRWRLRGVGRSRRNPADEPAPRVGDEVAAARALRDLADRLLDAASADISVAEHHPVHLRW